MRWFFRHTSLEVYRKSTMETPFSHLRFSNCDVQGHVISLLRMKIQHYPWKEETAFFLTSNQVKKQPQPVLTANKCTEKYARETSFYELRRLHLTMSNGYTCISQLSFVFCLAKKSNGNAATDFKIREMCINSVGFHSIRTSSPG